MPKVSELCRLCTLEGGAKVSIFEQDGEELQVLSRISSCLSIKVCKDDRLPKRICENCLYKLIMISDFREATVKSDEQLKKLLEEEDRETAKLQSEEHMQQADEEKEAEKSKEPEVNSANAGNDGNLDDIPLTVLVKEESIDIDPNEASASDDQILGLSEKEFGNSALQCGDIISKEEDLNSDDNNAEEYFHNELYSDECSEQTPVEIDIDQPGSSGIPPPLSGPSTSQSNESQEAAMLETSLGNVGSVPVNSTEQTNNSDGAISSHVRNLVLPSGSDGKAALLSDAISASSPHLEKKPAYYLILYKGNLMLLDAATGKVQSMPPGSSSSLGPLLSGSAMKLQLQDGSGGSVTPGDTASAPQIDNLNTMLMATNKKAEDLSTLPNSTAAPTPIESTLQNFPLVPPQNNREQIPDANIFSQDPPPLVPLQNERSRTTVSMQLSQTNTQGIPLNAGNLVAGPTCPTLSLPTNRGAQGIASLQPRGILAQTPASTQQNTLLLSPPVNGHVSTSVLNSSSASVPRTTTIRSSSSASVPRTTTKRRKQNLVPKQDTSLILDYTSMLNEMLSTQFSVQGATNVNPVQSSSLIPISTSDASLQFLTNTNAPLNVTSMNSNNVVIPMSGNNVVIPPLQPITSTANMNSLGKKTPLLLPKISGTLTEKELQNYSWFQVQDAQGTSAPPTYTTPSSFSSGSLLLPTGVQNTFSVVNVNNNTPQNSCSQTVPVVQSLLVLPCNNLQTGTSIQPTVPISQISEGKSNALQPPATQDPHPAPAFVDVKSGNIVEQEVEHCMEEVQSEHSVPENETSAPSSDTPENYYECPVCKMGVMIGFQLIRHINSHKTRPHEKYPCTRCDLTLDSVKELANHVKEHFYRKIYDYKCKTCSKQFPTQNSLNRHMVIHSSETPYACNICSKAFKRSWSLTVHKLVHSDDRFMCTICSRELKSRSTLYVHMESHRPKDYECETCHKKFFRIYSLRRHEEFHKAEMVACPVCCKLFASKRSLQCHVRTIHNKEKPTLRREHCCDVCGKILCNRGSLEKHTLTHLGVKPFGCKLCDKKYSDKEFLKVHMRTHSGERPFVCNECNKGFISKDHLKVHVRTHTGEKNYFCDICKKYFTQRSTLVIHRRYHTGERPYVCDICQKGFVSKTIMMMHKKRTHQKSLK